MEGEAKPYAELAAAHAGSATAPDKLRSKAEQHAALFQAVRARAEGGGLGEGRGTGRGKGSGGVQELPTDWVF